MASAKADKAVSEYIERQLGSEVGSGKKAYLKGKFVLKIDYNSLLKQLLEKDKIITQLESLKPSHLHRGTQDLDETSRTTYNFLQILRTKYDNDRDFFMAIIDNFDKKDTNRRSFDEYEDQKKEMEQHLDAQDRRLVALNEREKTHIENDMRNADLIEGLTDEILTYRDAPRPDTARVDPESTHQIKELEDDIEALNAELGDCQHEMSEWKVKYEQSQVKFKQLKKDHQNYKKLSQNESDRAAGFKRKLDLQNRNSQMLRTQITEKDNHIRRLQGFSTRNSMQKRAEALLGRGGSRRTGGTQQVTLQSPTRINILPPIDTKRKDRFHSTNCQNCFKNIFQYCRTCHVILKIPKSEPL